LTAPPVCGTLNRDDYDPAGGHHDFGGALCGCPLTATRKAALSHVNLRRYVECVQLALQSTLSMTARASVNVTTVVCGKGAAENEVDSGNDNSVGLGTCSATTSLPSHQEVLRDPWFARSYCRKFYGPFPNGTSFSAPGHCSGTAVFPQTTRFDMWIFFVCLRDCRCCHFVSHGQASTSLNGISLRSSPYARRPTTKHAFDTYHLFFGNGLLRRDIS